MALLDFVSDYRNLSIPIAIPIAIAMDRWVSSLLHCSKGDKRGFTPRISCPDSFFSLSGSLSGSLSIHSQSLSPADLPDKIASASKPGQHGGDSIQMALLDFVSDYRNLSIAIPIAIAMDREVSSLLHCSKGDKRGFTRRISSRNSFFSVSLGRPVSALPQGRRMGFMPRSELFLAKRVILKSAPGDFLVDTPVEATLHAQLGMPPRP